MKRIFIIIVSVAVIFGVLDVIQAHLTHRIYDLQTSKEMLMSEVISDLKKTADILEFNHSCYLSYCYFSLTFRLQL